MNTQAHRRGLRRLWHAGLISAQGLRAGCGEAAFRHELAWAVVLLPASFWVGTRWVEVALLAATVVAVLVVELINSCIEAVVDRIGPEWHVLSKAAKDMGSAAVLLTLLLCAGTWIAAIYSRWFA